MNHTEQCLEIVTEYLNRITKEESQNIQKATEILSQRIMQDQPIFVYQK